MATQLTEEQRRNLPMNAVTLTSLNNPNHAPFVGVQSGCMPAMKIRRVAGKAAIATPLRPFPDFVEFDVGWC